MLYGRGGLFLPKGNVTKLAKLSHQSMIFRCNDFYLKRNIIKFTPNHSKKKSLIIFIKIKKTSPFNRI